MIVTPVAPLGMPATTSSLSIPRCEPPPPPTPVLGVLSGAQSFQALSRRARCAVSVSEGPRGNPRSRAMYGRASSGASAGNFKLPAVRMAAVMASIARPTATK